MIENDSLDIPQGLYALGAWIDRTLRVWMAHWRMWTVIGAVYIIAQMGVTGCSIPVQ